MGLASCLLVERLPWVVDFASASVAFVLVVGLFRFRCNDLSLRFDVFIIVCSGGNNFGLCFFYRC